MRTEEHARMRAELLGKIQEWCGPFPDRGNLNIEEIAQTEYRTHTEIKLFYAGILAAAKTKIGREAARSSCPSPVCLGV